MPVADTPLTHGECADFQHKLFAHLDATDRRFDGLKGEMAARFDEVSTQLDGLYHRLGRLEDEYEAIKAALARLEGRVERVEQRSNRLEVEHRAFVLVASRLQERVGRLEQRLERRRAAGERRALSVGVQELRTRLEDLQARIEALERPSEP
jgi:chromosome segregation ATPase